MTLTPEQKQAVASWVAAGDNLSAVQKKLGEQFQITLTYRDVRFLVDDLNLALKDPAPKVDTTDVSKTPTPNPARGAAGEKKGFPGSAKGAPGVASDENPSADTEDEPIDEALEELPAGGGAVTIEVDKVTLLPG